MPDNYGREMPTLKDKHSIYESVFQRIDHLDPKKIILQRDRVLIEDIPDAEKIGSIWVPEVAKGLEQIRHGLVAATGPGDNCFESPEDQKRMRQGIVSLAAKSVKNSTGRTPMSVRVGDKVLYARRDDSEFYVGGKTFDLIYEEQSILAIMPTRAELLWGWSPRIGNCEMLGNILHGSDHPMVMLRDRVLISRDAVPQKEGSLYIPQNCAKERPEGLVVAVGPGKLKINGTFEPLEVKAGDQVAFRSGAGSSIKIKGERFLVVREDDIHGVIG